MDCARFEKTIDLLSSGRAEPALRSAGDRHLQACERCRRLYGNAQPYEDATKTPDLTRSILESTTGPACPAAEEALCQSFDDDNNGSRKRLVEMHLASCDACRDLAAVVDILRGVLPRLATCEPGEQFTAAVLAASRALPKRRPRPASNLGHIRERLLGRPLFAWEAAYAGTLLFALIFLNPVLPVGTVSLRAITATHNSAVSRLLPAEDAVSGLAHDFADELAVSGSLLGQSVRQWSSRTVTLVRDTARGVCVRFQPRPAPPNRTFLRGMRLPGCEATTDDHNRGDHV